MVLHSVFYGFGNGWHLCLAFLFLKISKNRHPEAKPKDLDNEKEILRFAQNDSFAITLVHFRHFSDNHSPINHPQIVGFGIYRQYIYISIFIEPSVVSASCNSEMFS